MHAPTRKSKTTAIGVVACIADPVLRRIIERLEDGNSGIAVLTVLAEPSRLGDVIAAEADVILLDMPLARLPDLVAEAALVVFADPSETEEGIAALQAGASAVLARTLTGSAIAAAIKSVVSGHAVISRELLAAMLPAASPAIPVDGSEFERVHLTARERDVLAAMADGISNKAIARRLGISVHTVKFHVAAILAKLDADSRTEAVAKAAQSGLVML